VVSALPRSTRLYLTNAALERVRMSTRTQTDVQRELAGALARVAALQAELERFSLVDRDQGAEVGSRLVGEPGSANPGPTCVGVQLSLREYERYGRQMILPEVGLPGEHILAGCIPYPLTNRRAKANSN
jgi:hypothetical protein